MLVLIGLLITKVCSHPDDYANGNYNGYIPMPYYPQPYYGYQPYYIPNFRPRPVHRPRPAVELGSMKCWLFLFNALINLLIAVFEPASVGENEKKHSEQSWPRPV